ncbi:uncharacterized protein [Penaeus vannamei]|uniref:uncharacterized protein n=1 Tax=Penaeus vannamei TaxID=6689 RepID=UPI00387F5C32
MGGGRLQAVLLLVVCAVTSLTSARYEGGIPLCKDLVQVKNEYSWEYMRGISDVNNDYPVNNTHEGCITNITLFDNQLKALKRCQNYSRIKEPCMMVEEGEDNNVHVLMLLLDVQCDRGKQADKVNGSLMCFHSVTNEDTAQAVLTVPRTESSIPQTMDTTVTVHTHEPEAKPVHEHLNHLCDKSIYGTLGLVISLGVNVIFVILIVIQYKRRNGSRRLNCMESPESGYRRCSSDGSFLPLDDMSGQT